MNDGAEIQVVHEIWEEHKEPTVRRQAMEINHQQHFMLITHYFEIMYRTSWARAPAPLQSKLYKYRNRQPNTTSTKMMSISPK